MKPANKLEVWDRLKTYSLSRFVCAVVANVVLVVLLKVKMNILGAYLFIIISHKSQQDGAQTKSTDFEIKRINPRKECEDHGVESKDPVLTDEEAMYDDDNDEDNDE